MGEVAATMTKKKKKKGRPSLLDLQKRSLKQQQQQQNPNFKNPNSLIASNTTSHRRSTRRRPNLDEPDWINGDEDDDDEDERKEKKHKLLLGLNSQQNNSNNDDNNNNHHYPISSANSLGPNPSYVSDGANPEAALKRRKGEKGPKATDTLHESTLEPGPTAPLPDKKLLVFILDRLQKKDTYGVFSEPVDREELPDYHDIIEHPMDFSTLRKKLDGGAYANLEQFEKDVFLICSNAMQYNSPDTIYFRQARSMQELARKDFENLRQDSDDGETQPKIVRRGRPPGKLKKSLERSPLDRVGPECSSDATLASGGDNPNCSTGYNLRRTHSYKYQPTDVLVRTTYGSHSSETYSTWMSEWENEFPASVLKAVLKYGKKPYEVDENRRDTYKRPSASAHGSSSLNLFGQMKQLMVVGLNAEHGYARSLARFAADVGPIAWKIASKKIESVLPTGLEFGPGWVGEDKVVEGQQQLLFSDRRKVSNSWVATENLGRLQSSTASGTNSGANSLVASRCTAWSREDMVENVGGLSSQSELNSLHSVIGGINPMSSVMVQQKPVLHSDVNGFSGGFGHNKFSPLMGTARLGIATGKSSSEQTAVPSQAFDMVSTSNASFCPMVGNDFKLNKAKLAETLSVAQQSGKSSALGPNPESQTTFNAGIGGKSSQQGLSPYTQQHFFEFPPDLNVGFLAPNSPSSSVPIGSPQQPDLALQL
ncbi:hypothetical protein P3X46_001917 [Hevea brasiliensis]|uniref:Bromo domain-containing protein n=1 Tax=Hevea brasiliensis TaxID=3981 RepID=A0ABQ9N191_HEVBR|nr:uncharacterized protein LOC110660971 isoform X2 [Hevea brasiliensis]KAJ9186334.1 hypothetical protein P3X46_001917 [Hevea brasiliensis]